MIEEAESMVYRRLRHWRMLVSPTAGTMTQGVDQIPPPADFLDPYLLYITGASAQVPGYGPQLISLGTPEQIIGSFAWDAAGVRLQMTPQMYYFDQTNIQLNCPPDRAYPYSLIYYQQPAPLSAVNPTNFLTQYYPRLMRAAIMAGATEWTKESATGQFDRSYWIQVAQAEIDEAQMESDMAKRSASNAMGMVFAGGGTWTSL
jgi:hypothetical protein